MPQLAFLAAGGFLAGFGAWALLMGRRAAAWRTVEGTIEEASDAITHGAGYDDRGVQYHRLRLRYRYDVRGRTLRGTRVYFGQTLACHPGHVRTLLARYPEGRAVGVRVDPGDPGNAVLEPGTHWSAWLLVAGGLLVALIAAVA